METVTYLAIAFPAISRSLTYLDGTVRFSGPFTYLLTYWLA